MSTEMSDRDRIEEAHGLWELEMVRLAAMVEVHARQDFIDEACNAARVAFLLWRKVSAENTRRSTETGAGE